MNIKTSDSLENIITEEGENQMIVMDIENLALFPNIGVFTPDEWLNEQGYRMIICGQHVAIYKNVDGVIYVYHIADMRTDYPSLF